MINKTEQDAKYKNIGYAEFNDSTLLTNQEKIKIAIYQNTLIVMLIGMLVIGIIGKTYENLHYYCGVAFILLIIYVWWAVLHLGRFVIKKCITLLGKEYFEYKENALIDEQILVKQIPYTYEEWIEKLANDKNFNREYCVKTKRFPLMFTKGVVYYFDYNIIVLFNEIPEWELLSLIDRKRINLVFCMKPVDYDQGSEELMSLVKKGYVEKDFDSVKVRFADIYFIRQTNKIIHRPRVVMLYPIDHFMKKFKYAKKPSVVVDYSMDISNFLISNILQIDV